MYFILQVQTFSLQMCDVGIGIPEKQEAKAGHDAYI